MPFINKTLEKLTMFKPRCEDFLLDLIKPSEEELDTIHYLFDMMKIFPASIHGFHGSYKGGLYDHTILVANLCYIMYNKKDQKLIKETIENYEILKVEDIIRTALFHDLGKVDNYTEMKNIKFKYFSEEKDRMMARYYIQRDYKVKGKDSHIERCICVVKNANLETNPTIQTGIIFHHGGWSGFYPNNHNSPIIPLIHGCDLIAARYYKI